MVISKSKRARLSIKLKKLYSEMRDIRTEIVTIETLLKGGKKKEE
jgi:hypothetical protein